MVAVFGGGVARTVRRRTPIGLSAGPVFLTMAAGLAFPLSQLGGPAGLPLMAVPMAVLLTLAVGGAEASDEAEPLPDRLATLTLVGLGLAWAVGMFGAGEILPIGDPIAVPQFARSIAAGTPLTEAFPPGSSGHAYPPGYPILFAPAAAWLPADAALVLFKWLSVATAGLIPTAWGLMHRRLFAPQSPSWLVVGAAYAAFVLIERHLGFLTPFAGKNAVEFALLLFPGVVLASLRLLAAPRLWPLAALPLYGLFLIHYSMAHLAAAFLSACLALGRPWRWADIARAAAVGGLAVAALLVTNGEALHDPRTVTAPWTPGAGLAQLLRLATAARPDLVIFHDADFGLAPALYRVPVLAGAAALAVLIGLRLRDPSLWRPALVYAAALAVSLAFGCGVVPAGISFDFVRCYAWTLQAALFLTAGLALFAAWRQLEGRVCWAASAAGAAALLAASAVGLHDMRIERAHFAGQALSRQDVRQITGALPRTGPCVLLTAGQAQPRLLITVQNAAPWNYAEAVSPCRYLTGSWVQPGAPGGRDEDGLPSAAALRATPTGAPIYFAGSAERLSWYAASLHGQGLPVRWTRVATQAGGVAVWRLVLPPQASKAM